MSETSNRVPAPEGDEGNTSLPSLPVLRNLATNYQIEEAVRNEPKRRRESRRDELGKLLEPLTVTPAKDQPETPKYVVPDGVVNNDDLPPDVPFFVSLHTAGKYSKGEFNTIENMVFNISSVHGVGNNNYIDNGGLSEREPGKEMDEETFTNMIAYALEIKGTLGAEDQSQTSMTLGWLIDPSSVIVREGSGEEISYKVIGPDNEQFQVFEDLVKVAAEGVAQDPQFQTPQHEVARR